MKNIYENMYADEKNFSNLIESPRIKIMLSMINSLNLHDKKILDVGCYDGTFLASIRNRNNDFYGLDASDWNVNESRKKGIRATHFFFDDEKDLPYANNFFDIVIAGEIIEHIYDTDFFIEEIRRVMKSGGKIILSTPNLASLGRRIFLLLGLNPFIEVSPNEAGSVGHIRYFTISNLIRLLEKHNFKILKKKSDCVNFSGDGKIKSLILAKVFPNLGGSIIIVAEKLSAYK